MCQGVIQWEDSFLKTFNILSIDGGGILGLYSASMLDRIQTEFFNDKSFADSFQLITGTSTGGIIALALATGAKASEVVEFYKKYGTKIFPKTKRKGLVREKYKNTELKHALEAFFGNKTITDCKTKVCIPAIDVCNSQPLVFKTNNNGSQTRDLTCKLVDIAMATSAAPTFFPIYKFNEYLGLMDGGLWQNNPSLFGVIEANNCFVGKDKEYDSINLMSIGNPLSSLPSTINYKSGHSGAAKLNASLITMPMKISSIGTHQILSFLNQSHALNIQKYLRIESINISSECRKLSMDKADDEAFNLMLSICQNDFNLNKTKLQTFFKEA